MFRTPRFIALPCVLSLFLLSGCESPTALRPIASLAVAKSDNAPIHHVSGGGTVQAASGLSKYQFRASVDGAGVVKGSFELHFTSVDANVHGDVKCLIVVGNRALLSGVVTRSDNDERPVGFVFHWQAIDNGEGAKAAPDQITPFFNVADPTVCNYADQSGIDWTNGNVQIR